MPYITAELIIYNNDGSTRLYESGGDPSLTTWTVTENGSFSGEDAFYKYVYEGTSTFIGLATEPNATTPTYAVGDTFFIDQSQTLTLYIVERGGGYQP